MKNTIQSLIDQAITLGCQQCAISYAGGFSRSVELRDGEVEVVQQSNECRLTLSLYVDGRFGRYSTNRIEPEELNHFLTESIAMTRLIAPDPLRRLPAKELMFEGNEEDLGNYYPQAQLRSLDEIIPMLTDINAQMKSADYQTVSTSVSYSDDVYTVSRADSNGVWAERARSFYSVSTYVSLMDQHEIRTEGYWSTSNAHFDRLNLDTVGTIALQRASDRFDQQKLPAGTYDMVVENRLVGQLLSPILNAINGNHLYQKNSFLIDALDKLIVSPKITLVDNPHQKDRRGAARFDGQGVTTSRRTIIENGLLRAYYTDDYSAQKLGMETTTSSPSLLEFELGTESLEQFVGTISDGLLITSFNGGNCNPATGDFSFGIEGIRIENGQRTYPFSGANLTGNILKLWTKVDRMGNSVFEESYCKSPDILFAGVEIQ